MNQTIMCSGKREPSSILLINHKNDEKLLSESLYRNLHVIKRFQNPTPNFLSIYEPHMFIKPNPKAFLHVFHLIFICLDAAEFNKRFLWPIYDKASETRFRTSTLDYINHLNTIHQLGFETLKLHNIHIPGGLKFIKIVHKMSFLAMKITLSRNAKSIPNANDIHDADEQLAKLEVTIDEGLDFAARLQAQSNLVRARTDEMKRTMASFFQDSSISVAIDQCWSCLLEQWRKQLDQVVENDVSPKLERVAVVSKYCADLKPLLIKLFVERKDNVIEYDKTKLVIAQKVLMKWNPNLEQAIAGMIQNNSINFDHLLQVFQFILPRIMEKIEKFEFRDLKAIEYESDQIDILDARVSQVQTRYMDFGNEIQPFLKKEAKLFGTFCLNVPNLPFRIMQTPTVARKVDTARKRFAFMDDNPARIKLFNETLPSKSRTICKPQNLNATIATGSSECMFPVQSSKSRSDAMQILLKNKNSRLNATKTYGDYSLSKVCSPKFSSTMCSTAVKSHERKHLGDELKISPVYPNVQATLTAPKNTMENAFLSPNSSVQRKFSTNSVHRLDHANLRGSPTRRWEINSQNAAVHQNLHVPTSVNGHHSREQHQDQVDNDFENLVSTLGGIRIDEEEFLGNISDTILNNVTN